MPLPEPTDLDKAGQLRFEELEGSMKQLNKEIECNWAMHVFNSLIKVTLFRHRAKGQPGDCWVG